MLIFMYKYRAITPFLCSSSISVRDFKSQNYQDYSTNHNDNINMDIQSKLSGVFQYLTVPNEMTNQTPCFSEIVIH